MNIITATQNSVAGLYLTMGEIEVLALMARTNFTIKQIKDAVQYLHTTDITTIESYLINASDS